MSKMKKEFSVVFYPLILSKYIDLFVACGRHQIYQVEKEMATGIAESMTLMSQRHEVDILTTLQGLQGDEIHMIVDQS